jgi:superfamily II DNA or RNA helicase
MLRCMSDHGGATAGGADIEAPPEWVSLLTHRDLERRFGVTTAQRGLSYQRSGAVQSLVHGSKPGSILATVLGSRLYRTVVEPELLDDDGHFDVFGACSCPVAVDCKHAVALIAEAQARVPAIRGAPRPEAEQPGWERMLAPVVRQSLDTSRTGGAPLGLLIEVTAAVAHPWDTKRRHPRLELRPVIPGAKGGWIRTGIVWSDLQYSEPLRGFDPRQWEALSMIVLAQRIHANSYYLPGQWLSADSIGPRLWGMLEDAVAAGVSLVTGPRGNLSVALSRDPATTVVDVVREDGEVVVVRSMLRVPGTTARPVPIGTPAHGVFVPEPNSLILARLEQPLSTQMARLVDSVGPIIIPGDDAGRFLTHYYPALRQRAVVESSDGSVALPEVLPPRLALEVTFKEGHRAQLRWAFQYRVGEESMDVPLLPTAHSATGTAPRDAAAEEGLLASLDILGAVPGLLLPVPGKSRPGVVVQPILQGWPTILFIRDVLPALMDRDDVDVTIVGSPLDYTEVVDDPVIEVSARDIEEADDADLAQDWFDLGIAVRVAEREVPLSVLLTALARGDEQLILDDGTWFTLDRPELHALRRVMGEARALQDRESDELRINRYQAGLWEELVELGVVSHQSQRWAQSVGALLALEDIPQAEPPLTLAATLRPYQLDGFQWLSFLWDQRLGGILADDMGLGKTLQTLAMAERARVGGTLTPDAPLLVVAPTSVIAAWQSEAAKFAPELTVTTITQTVKRSGAALPALIAGAHLVVTSYALFRIDAEHYRGQEWGALILDEAQFVKNHQSRTYQVARTLRAPVKIAITGTPLENSLMDLWALLSITAPGLFPNPQRFSELFRKPIESGSAPELLATLRRRIRPVMLRRTKEAVASDLPPKIEQTLAVPLNAAHRRIYDTHLQRERQRILGLLDDVDRNRVAILTGLTRLRQLSLDVHLVVPDAPANVRSSKVDALLEQLREVIAEGHRCLVFSQFTSFLQIVRRRLTAEGIDYVYLDGRTRARPKRIAEFTEGDAPVFLISLKAGGSGLTLTEADYVFVLDPWWNPAVEAQAIDRTHRIGQDKTVMVYRLVSEGTIEEKVVALQEQKRALFDRVVDEGGLMAAPLTAEDIRGLLGA